MCTGKELEDAAKDKESSESDNNKDPTSEEDSETDVVDKKIKKASTRKKSQKSLKVNIKKTQESSELTAYRPYKVKVQGRKGKKQQLFHDSGSGLHSVGKKKMEEDGAVLVKEVPDDLDVVDFNRNTVKIIGYTIYMIAPLGTDNYKPKKFFVAPAVEDDELLVGLET